MSVGLPVRDGERYLPATLDAILGQDCDAFDLVISDNASTDATEEICRDYAGRDRRISYSRTAENLGAAANYNRVFHLSTGTLFKWAAHDDLLAPNYLRTCLEAFDEAPEDIALVYPRTTLIAADGSVLREFDDGLDLRSPDPAQRLRQLAANWNLCNPCFGVMRRDVLRRTRLIGPYLSSDVTLLAEIALRGRYWELPDRLFFRRIHERSSRQGTLTLREAALWFDPARKRAPVLPPRMRVYLEILASIGRSELRAADRIRCAAVLSLAWHARRLRVWAGRARRALAHVPPGRAEGRA